MVNNAVVSHNSVNELYYLEGGQHQHLGKGKPG